MKKFHLTCLLSLLPTLLFAQFAFYDSLNQIHWAQIAPPSGEDFGFGQILREGLGYLGSSSGAIYEYDASRPEPWRRLPQPEPYSIHEYFALAPDDIWAAIEIPETYNRMLYHWDGKEWSPSFSGNVQNIRALTFASPQEGWIGGEYGEFWHYQRGQWQPEKLPAFIHVDEMKALADSALYLLCEAPAQNALMRYHRGVWQTIFTNVEGNLRGPALTASRRLLLTNDQTSSVQRIAPATRPVWRMPLLQLELFSNGMGYGVHNKTIYAIQDTTLLPLVEAPVELHGAYLFNERFSWITGAEGLILAPQTQPPATAPPPPERVFVFRDVKLSSLYGLAIVQKQAGKFSHVYCVQTARPNVLLAPEVFRRSDAAALDQAAKYNLAEPSQYAERRNSSGGALANFDQALVTGDLNGDGRDDVIIISMYGHPFVYLQTSHDYFLDATDFSGLKKWGYVEQRPMLGVLFDADRDGDLDLFIACQFQSNAFFLNNGHAQFTEATQVVGLENEGGSIGAFVADFDNDGWEDLYVTCANRPNLMYRNLGQARFVDMSAESGEACWPSLKHAQGAALADYDNDGDCDIFVCVLEAGNRLLQNDGNGVFADVTAQAGLAGRDQSFGATFFDADNDGDLDLVVANRGKDRFYKNLGGRFLEQSALLGGSMADRNLLMFPGRQFGSSSYGSLAFDFDNDEDLDVFLGNFDDGLFFFQNGLNAPATSLRIFPEGIVSNRSAVGAKVFLYEAGKLNAPSALIGSRQIESANSFGCSPAKVAHFGVAPSKLYDAKIVFPSGLARELRGLRGGEAVIVKEIEGITAEALKAQRTLTDLLLGYRSRERYLLFTLGVLLLALLLYLARKLVGLAQRELAQLALLYGATLLLVFLFWFAASTAMFVLRPLIFSAVLTGLAMAVMRTQRLYRGRVASMEMLHARLNAFGHGSLIRQLMDRLAFFAENLSPEDKLSDEKRRRLLEAASGAAHFLQDEIEAIRAYQASNNFATDLAYRLDDTWAVLKRVLKRLQESLSQPESFDHNALQAAVKLQERMRGLIVEFKQRAERHYRAEVPLVVKDFLRRLEHEGVSEHMPEKLPAARVLPSDLVYVLDELVQNALRHVEGRRPNIAIAARHAIDEIHIEVRDNGCGIAEHLWEEIFRAGFTTKKNAPGGFGLYHARQRLEKYGAKIFVAESKLGEGTTMRICLPAAEA